MYSEAGHVNEPQCLTKNVTEKDIAKTGGKDALTRNPLSLIIEP
jgi:hypothetical protein